MDLRFNLVIAEHMSPIDKFNASFPSTAQIASAARQGSQLLGNSEWVKTLVRPIDRCVVDSLTSLYTGGLDKRILEAYEARKGAVSVQNLSLFIDADSGLKVWWNEMRHAQGSSDVV